MDKQGLKHYLSQRVAQGANNAFVLHAMHPCNDK